MDSRGHYTRYSDSSFYDEVCLFCGATDGHGGGLYSHCTNSLPKDATEYWIDVSYPVMPKFVVERDFVADPPRYRWREGHWPRDPNEVLEWSYDPPPSNSHFA